MIEFVNNAGCLYYDKNGEQFMRSSFLVSVTNLSTFPIIIKQTGPWGFTEDGDDNKIQEFLWLSWDNLNIDESPIKISPQESVDFCVPMRSKRLSINCN